MYKKPLLFEVSSNSGKTCLHCTRWSNKGCNHPRHNNHEIDRPCPMYKYKNNYRDYEKGILKESFNISALPANDVLKIVTAIKKKMLKDNISKHKLSCWVGHSYSSVSKLLNQSDFTKSFSSVLLIAICKELGINIRLAIRETT